MGEARDTAIAATEDNLWSMWRQFGQGEGCRLIDTPEVLRFETPIRYVPYNSVLRFTADGSNVDALIDDTLAAYPPDERPLVWMVHPSTRPADIGTLLERRGLVEAEVIPGMFAEIDTLPRPDADAPEGIVIEELGPDATEPFVQLVAWRYSLPPEAMPALQSIMTANRFGYPDAPTRAWVARRGDTIVSKAVLHLSDNVAGIHGVATRPEGRGLGLARSLTLHALDAARRTGRRHAVLHSTAMAFSLYQTLGFRAVCDFRLYSTPGTLHL